MVHLFRSSNLDPDAKSGMLSILSNGVSVPGREELPVWN